MKEKISSVQELCIAAAQNMFASGSIAHIEYFPLLAVPQGKLVKVEISVIDECETIVPLESDEVIQQSIHTSVTIRACVSANCGWIGKESACLKWKHAGDERICPYCNDNTEPISLSDLYL